MLQINGLKDVRDLSADSIFLVPPKAGTYTPTPGAPPPETATAEATESGEPASEPTATPTPSDTPSPIPSPTLLHIATAASAPRELLMGAATAPAPGSTEALLVAAVPTLPGGTPGALPPVPSVVIVRSGPSPWLTVAVVVQVCVLLAAGFEFFRRRGKHR